MMPMITAHLLLKTVNSFYYENFGMLRFCLVCEISLCAANFDHE